MKFNSRSLKLVSKEWLAVVGIESAESQSQQGLQADHLLQKLDFQCLLDQYGVPRQAILNQVEAHDRISAKPFGWNLLATAPICKNLEILSSGFCKTEASIRYDLLGYGYKSLIASTIPYSTTLEQHMILNHFKHYKL